MSKFVLLTWEMILKRTIDFQISVELVECHNLCNFKVTSTCNCQIKSIYKFKVTWWYVRLKRRPCGVRSGGILDSFCSLCKSFTLTVHINALCNESVHGKDEHATWINTIPLKISHLFAFSVSSRWSQCDSLACLRLDNRYSIYQDLTRLPSKEHLRWQ